MVLDCMSDNNFTQWSEGLRFVQFQENNGLHRDIRQPPFEALFGRKVTLGLHESTVPPAVIANLRFKEDFENALSFVQLYSSSTDTKEIAEAQVAPLLENNSSSDEEEMRLKLHSRIERNQDVAVQRLELQAKRLKPASEANFSRLEKGTTVTVPLPDFLEI